jgi:TonB-linked SusC/RagA family outer membrane protein
MKNNSSDEVFLLKRKLKKLLLIMRLSALFLMILSLNLTASVYSQNTKFTVDLNGKTVREVFQFIEQQSEFRFFYNDDFSYIDKVVEMNVKGENVEQILERLFESSDITYKVFDNNLVVLTLKQSLQQVTLNGVITDASTNEALPGANIQIKGTNQGTTADLNGRFAINVNRGDVLVFSFIGYLAQEVTVQDESMMTIALLPDVRSLDEVVVVGYGTQRRAEVTGAITSVSSEKLTSLPTGTLDQALQGRAAGLTVINNGSPGNAPTMRIRGISTVNNNEPLYVVDGVVTTSISSLNPNDIESVQILKDASTTAIYGSLGSSGVIMVTTKKGIVGKPVVTLDSYLGTQWTTNRFDLMNTEEYLEYASTAFAAPLVITDNQYASRLNGETDWQDEIFQSAPMKNLNLGVSGGGENSSYRLSAGYLNQDGIIIHTGYERYNFRANSDFTRGRLKIGENISISLAHQNPLPDAGGRSILEHTIKMAPYLSVYNPDNPGGYQGPTSQIDGQDAENPVRILELNSFDLFTTDVLGSLYAELEIFKGLKYKSVAGLQDIRIDDNQFYPMYTDDNLGFSTHTATSATTRKNKASYRSLIFTNSLNYEVTLADKHNFELLALVESSIIKRTLTNASSTSSISNEIEQLGNTQSNLSSTSSEYRRIGYLARLNYNFDQKYLFAASWRNDASSRFGSNKRWSAFPSLAVGWNIAREGFMENIAMISNMKLRASWGKAGNDKIGDYTYSTTLTTNMFYNLANEAIPGVTPFGFANPNLKWEETTMTNIGLDLGLLDNQFTLSAEYYINKSDDLLMSVPLPESMGVFSGVKSENAASIETRGVEFQLGYNDFEGAFQWSTNLNLGTFTNEVLSLGTATFLGGFGFENETITRSTIGEPAFYFYGYEFDGIFQSPSEATSYMGGSQATTFGSTAGDFRIKDLHGTPNEDGTFTGPDGIIDQNDRTNLGNSLPKLTIGFDLNASFKGLDFNMFISGVYGNKIYNTNIYDLEGMPRLFNASPKVLDRWTPDNPSNTVPRAGVVSANVNQSSRYIESGAFTRLRNITLGYTIPANLLKNKITKVRIYVSAQNLITITDYSGLDPEVGTNTTVAANLGDIGTPRLGAGNTPTNNVANGVDVGNYPIPKSFIGGIQITF